MLTPKELEELSRLMDMTDAEYDHWLDTASDEDIDRSIELFEAGRLEMSAKAQSLETILDAVEDTSLAQETLRKYTLRGRIG
jgi:hypothetical protein